MKSIFKNIKDNPLWSGIEYAEFERICQCAGARAQSFKKGGVVLLSGSAVNFVGLIISGGIRIIKEDANGNTTILTELGASEIFGETFACAGIGQSPVTVLASEESEILFINYKRIISICSSACDSHSKLVENMLRLIAKKNLMLNQKIDLLSKRTTREKLIAFFDAQRSGAKKFTIPYNRDELARYLCVDRSAMSNELCKMRNEGLIEFKKNKFELK